MARFFDNALKYAIFEQSRRSAADSIFTHHCALNYLKNNVIFSQNYFLTLDCTNLRATRGFYAYHYSRANKIIREHSNKNDSTATYT